MFRTTALTAALLAGAIPISPASAQEDVQLWLGTSAELPLADGVTIVADASQRFRSASAGGDQQLLRAGLQVDVADWLTLGAGAAYLDGSTNEKRLFQSATLHTGNLALRTQLEERFFDGAARAQLRGRERIQLTFPIDSADRLLASAELNYILRDQDPAKQDRVDNWRVRLDWRHRFSPHLELAAGYMAQLAPRADAPDWLSHIPSLSIAYRF
jgi:hypothetical protein